MAMVHHNIQSLTHQHFSNRKQVSIQQSAEKWADKISRVPGSSFINSLPGIPPVLWRHWLGDR